MQLGESRCKPASWAYNQPVFDPVIRTPYRDREMLKLPECSMSDSLFSKMVIDHAAKHDLDERALTVRMLLHLPRVASCSGRMRRWQVTNDLARVGEQLRQDVQAAGELVAHTEHALRDLSFERIPSDKAARIFTALHYLRSVRPGAMAFALLDPVHRLPVSLCAVSPLEWHRVGAQIQSQFGVPRNRIWDVSRVYASSVAPRYAISYLLARVRNVLRRSEQSVDLLTTAVDRNLGFTGASYRAANWQPWLSVQPRPYLYHNGWQVSPRQLRQRFGSSSLTELRASHPNERFEQSHARLRDSLIFCWRLRGATEQVPEQERRRLRR